MLALLHGGLSLLAASDSEGGFGAIGLVFLLSGFVFYAYVFFRYRNVAKRHHHETETAATKLNVQTVDEKIRTLTGLSNAKMSGANNTAVQGAGGMPFSMNQLKGLTSQFGSVMGQIQQQAASQGTVPSASEPGTAPHPTTPPPPGPASTSPPPAAPGAAPTPRPASPPPPVAPPASQPPPPAAPPGPPPGSGQSF